MTVQRLRNGLPVLLSLVLWITSSIVVSGFQAPTTDSNDPGAPTQAAPQTESELRALVAPIALYPDNLVAEILAASTFPDQVAVAQYWLQAHSTLKGDALTPAVDKESWNESVKALTAFPTVLDNMAKSLSWVSQLGEAYHNQKSDVMAAIQALRAQSKA